MTEEKKKIIKILRSLIISNPQEGVFIKTLLNDFTTFEGVVLPLFGYKTAVEFLRASGEFVIENVRGEFMVYAKTTAESKHIARLVSEQNKPRKFPFSQIQRSVRSQPPNSRSFSFHNTKSFVDLNNTHHRIGQHNSIQQLRHQRNNTPTIEYSFEQLQSQLKGLEDERKRKTVQTIEVSFEQLQSQQKGSNDERRKAPASEFSFQQLQSPQKGLDDERKSAPTIEYSFEQLRSQQIGRTDEPQRKNVPTIEFSFEELKLQHTENNGGKNTANRCVSSTASEPDQPTYSEQSRSSQTGLKTEINNNEVDFSAVEDSIDDYACIEHQQMNELELPWKDEYWSLFVTCCTSTTEIWGKLFGKHSCFDALALEFQDDVLANKRVATVYNVGHIYLTVICNLGYRVRLDRVDQSTNQILCFFVDDGDRRWLDMNEIYNCRSVFMKYPPQAICFALYGLKDFPVNNGIARKHLENTYLNQLLTGQIFTKKEDFISTNDSKAVIQVVFYDPFVDNDINLHSKIVKQIYGDISVPELFAFKLTPVNVTHIDDNGDIFCQLHRNNVNCVNKLMKEFVRQTFNNPFLPLEKTARISNENLVVVHDNETHGLYRAKVIRELKEEKTMFFIDYGMTKTLQLPEMYYVESNHELLKYPPQAIRAKLSGMSEVPESLVSRLRDHFSGNKNAYVKNMQSNTIVPEVKLYFDAKSFIVCVNDSFGLETERNQIIDRTNDGDSNDGLCTSFHDLAIDGSELSRTLSSTSVTSNIKTFEPPAINSSFEVVIVQTESPSNFVIKPIKYMSLWHEQMKSLQCHCKNTSETIQLEMIKEGEPYACLKSNGYWYRAFIKLHRSKLYAFFCDIADIDSIDDVKKIKFLPEEYRVIPKLAITARLFGIEPVISVWDMDDKIQFHRITKGKKFQAIVARVVDDGKGGDNYILEISLIYESYCINDLFVESRRAVRL